MGDRARVLERVRAALTAPSRATRGLPDVYPGSPPHDGVDWVKRFIDRVQDYRASVRTTNVAALPDAVRVSCHDQTVRHLVVPPDVPIEWTCALHGIDVVVDDDRSVEHLDRMDGTLTGCALAIAETGTIVLDGGPGQGRRAITLVPDYHLCVVRADQIVPSVDAAVAQLETAVRDERRPITLISGPSATSDIELKRVEGVHGPRRLELLLVV